MRYATELIGKQIISTDTGRKLGTVKDLYFDSELRQVTGVFLGTEGLMRRKVNFIRVEDVEIFGEDAVLVISSEVVHNSETNTEFKKWVRRDTVTGRNITTEGGSAVGTIGNIVLDENAAVQRISLGRIDMSSPVTGQGFVSREVVTTAGAADASMQINLAAAEALVTG